jgi:hypothetical protein
MKWILIAFVLTASLLISGDALALCCKDADTGQPKCFPDTGLCCNMGGKDEYWSPLVCLNSFEFHGDTNYFNVFWNMLAGSSDVNVNIVCVLNGSTGQNCFPNPVVQKSGRGTCTVVNPKYNYTSMNKIECTVYNPTDMSVASYYYKTFKLIDYDITGLAPISATVGERMDLKISVTNNGFLSDNYTVYVVSSDPSSVLVQSGGQSPIHTISGGYYSNSETSYTYASLVSLLSKVNPVDVNVYVTSWTDSTFNQFSSCTADNECGYLGSDGVCFFPNPPSMNGMCAKVAVLRVQNGIASLPDFGTLGVVEILSLASVLFISVALVEWYRKTAKQH